MLPTRPTYHHGDLRNSLIRAALTLVAERGVDGFSLRGAARTVGVSPSACYRHFADREALLAAVAHEGLDTLAEAMRVAAAPYGEPTAPQVVRRFWAYSSAYLHFALEHPAHFRVMHALPKSEQSRGMMLPRTPAVLAQAGMDALVEAGVDRARGGRPRAAGVLDVGARPGVARGQRAGAARRRLGARRLARRRPADGPAGRRCRCRPAAPRAAAAGRRLSGHRRARSRRDTSPRRSSGPGRAAPARSRRSGGAPAGRR